MEKNQANHKDNSRKNFYKAWLAIGVFQILSLAALDGCSSTEAMPVAASARTPAQTVEDTLLSNSEPQVDQQAALQGGTAVLRISRAFFERILQADLTVGVDKTYQSHVQWEEQPTTLPPPNPSEGPVLADFRDYIGCAVLGDLRGGQEQTRLCFKVMPDVSNLGINDREMDLQGVRALGNPGDCPSAGSSAPVRYHVISAVRTERSLTLRFSPAEGVAGSAQGCSMEPVELTFRQTS